jgi:hypothetical protein
VARILPFDLTQYPRREPLTEEEPQEDYEDIHLNSETGIRVTTPDVTNQRIKNNDLTSVKVNEGTEYE